MRVYTCSNSLRNVYGTCTTWEKMNFDVMSNILHSDLFHQIIIAISAEIRLCLLSGLTSSKYCSSLHWLEVIKFWFLFWYTGIMQQREKRHLKKYNVILLGTFMGISIDQTVFISSWNSKNNSFIKGLWFFLQLHFSFR